MSMIKEGDSYRESRGEPLIVQSFVLKIDCLIYAWCETIIM